jgi:flagella basal body P-ring formation protein FlgA
MVHLIVQGRGFTVSSEGEALGKAAPGERLQVRTPSGQVVTGVVNAAGQVEVGM